MLVENQLQGQVDLYLLKLVFDHYPKGPPSAQFINPLTMNYTIPNDVRWVPKCENAPDIHFHPNYNNVVQLICSSTTLEFYKVNHEVKAEWAASTILAAVLPHEGMLPVGLLSFRLLL
jgi:hypothetical protein